MSEALAYRIWAYCTPREWNATSQEIAEALDETIYRVARTVRWKGWSNRIRANPKREAYLSNRAPLITERGPHGLSAALHELGLDIPHISEDL